MRGMEEAAGGVESARSSRRTKNATNMFMPGEGVYESGLRKYS